MEEPGADLRRALELSGHVPALVSDDLGRERLGSCESPGDERRAPPSVSASLSRSSALLEIERHLLDDDGNALPAAGEDGVHDLVPSGMAGLGFPKLERIAERVAGKVAG